MLTNKKGKIILDQNCDNAHLKSRKKTKTSEGLVPLTSQRICSTDTVGL